MSAERSSSALVIGEALVDVIARADGSVEEHPGGSPMNVAVGLSRLGMDAVLHSQFGVDRYGELIAAHLAANDVHVASGSMDAQSTSFATATIGADGSASYVFDVTWDPQPTSFPEAPGVVHAGSIGAVVHPGSALVDAELGMLRESATVTYDPNIRPQLMGGRESTLQRVLRLVAGADVVKASDEDIAWLYPDTDPRQVAQDWFALGPSMVVVTFGSGGAHATTHAGSIHVAALTVPVADSVGAGDSFMAGLIAALDDRGLLGRRHITDLMAMDLNSAREVVEFAARCAAITVSRRGANPPTRAELQLSRPLAAPLCETLS